MEKEKVLQVLDAMPSEVDVETLVEKLYLLQKIEAAERQLERGEGVPHTEAKRRLQQWLK